MKLTAPQVQGLFFFAHLVDPKFPVGRFQPRVCAGLQAQGALEPCTEDSSGFRITQKGLDFLTLLWTFPEGRRVQLHPCTDQWMMGDRFGSVTQVKNGLVYVKMDRSGKTLKCQPDHILVKNPAEDFRLTP